MQTLYWPGPSFSWLALCTQCFAKHQLWDNTVWEVLWTQSAFPFLTAYLPPTHLPCTLMVTCLKAW